MFAFNKRVREVSRADHHTTNAFRVDSRSPEHIFDRGPDSVKEKIQSTLDQFLAGGSSSELSPNNTDKPLISNPPSPTPSPPAPTTPVVSDPSAAPPAHERGS